MTSRFAVPLLSVLSFLLIALVPTRADAFDYLEHSYFTDRACRVAQEILATRISAGSKGPEVARYLALAIMCPAKREAHYCKDGVKNVHAGINKLPKTGKQAMTLGDFAALADHVSAYGPVRGLPPPAKEPGGLVDTTFLYMASDPADLSGIIADVQENACQSNAVDWERVEKDLDSSLVSELTFRPKDTPPELISPLRRTTAPRGPRDPAAVYSFDNPHFLDLVLNDSNHFGQRAHATWLGFHSTALTIANARCERIINFTDQAYEAMTENFPVYRGIDWSALDENERQRQGCALLSRVVERRLNEWKRYADRALVEPVAAKLIHLSPEERKQVVSAVIALVFEGTAAHYIEDGLSAGHLRTPHSLRALEDRRYAHDFDNQNGLLAVVPTASGERRFVAFGDSYLLGAPQSAASNCAPVESLSPEAVTDCLLANQRSAIILATAASLLDWAAGGPSLIGNVPVCDGSDLTAVAICNHLPVDAPSTPGFREPKINGRGVPLGLAPGALPVPHKPYKYQSLAFNTAMDLAGSGNQSGLDMAFFEALGSNAGWLTSYRVGLRTEEGIPENRQFSANFSYGFHWRWAARFLIDAEPFVYAGMLGTAPDRAVMFGLGPKTGITALPEGWVKIPLEISLSYRLPLRLYNSKSGFFGNSFEVEAHWLQFSLGLAFM